MMQTPKEEHDRWLATHDRSEPRVFHAAWVPHNKRADGVGLRAACGLLALLAGLLYLVLVGSEIVQRVAWATREGDKVKRNKTNKRVGSGGISPYKKYAKRPYRYSEAYYQWRSKFRKKEDDRVGLHA